MNRIVAASIAGVVLLALLGLGALYGMHKPEYAVLFSNLSAEDASAVTLKLKDAKVPYQLTDGGKTVRVPAESVYEERVALAGAGVVKGGGTGYELFDKMNLGMTDSQEKIQRIRAIEGELQRTISGLTEVDAARVHIAMPDPTLYSSSQEPTTASIAIHSKPGMTLDPSEVKGITMLAVGAVDGLKPEHVTIVNQDGSILNSGAQSGGEAAAADALKLTQDQLVAKQRYEASLQENVQGMLDAVLGAKRSAVRIATDMSFDANTTETKSYAPQGTVRSQQSERESYTGGAPQRGAVGVPGTTTNTIPTYQGTQNGNGNGRYNKSKNTVNYEVSESSTKHIDAPGKVLRTSVAVLVNVPGAAAGPPVPNAYRLSVADVAKIRNVVAAAAGVDMTRGDQISVEAIPFAPGPAELAPGTATSTVLGIPVVALAVIAGLVLLGAAGFGAMLYRRKTFRPQTGELPTFDSTLAEELPSFEEHPMLEGSPSLAAPIRSAADLTREQMIEYVTTVANENPDSIAKLVKLWLAE